MLDVTFVGEEGKPVIVDRTKVVAVGEMFPDAYGKAQCWIYVSGINIPFRVKGTKREIVEMIQEGSDAPDEDTLQAGSEASPAFDEPEVPHPNVWRNMSSADRDEWNRQYTLSGMVSFRCLTCGYPTDHGQGWCVSCAPEKYAKEGS